VRAHLPWRHFLLALAVVGVWGSNFVVIRIALGHLPPLLLATLRFTAALFPAVFFLPRPAVRWGNLALYGILIGVVQFGLLYIAMNGHISPGLASLVIQVQVFFTIGLSIALDGERVRRFQWFALLLAAAGIAVIAAHAGGATTLGGLAMTLVAALAWAGGNIAAKHGRPRNILAYVVWASLFAVPPLLVISLLTEGWSAIVADLRGADAATWAAVAWQGWGNTLFGYAAWAWLLARHPAATVTPMALLIPVVGMGTSALWLAEPLPGWKLAAAALVVAGLAANILWPVIVGAVRR
jgi:O-acetylserine/cysteine efflux transporter